MNKNVSILGLGAMGSRMAANLIKDGYAVTVWNRTAEAGKAIVAQGGNRRLRQKKLRQGLALSSPWFATTRLRVMYGFAGERRAGRIGNGSNRNREFNANARLDSDNRQNMNMTQQLTLVGLVSTLSLWLIPALLEAREPQTEVQQILQTTHSWEGTNYQSYPTGQPQLTVLRIKVPPNTALHWHHHPVISVGYVLSGDLTLEKKETGERTIVHAGQALAETVQTTHRGFTTKEPVELIVFYAGQVGVPITVNEE